MENFVFPNKIKTKLMKTSKLMSVFSYLNLNFQRSFPHDFNYANFWKLCSRLVVWETYHILVGTLNTRE